MSELRPSHAAGRRAVSNVIFRAGGEVSGKLATFALFAVMTRELPEADVGAYVVAFAYVQIATILIDLGFDRVLIRRIALDPGAAGRLFTDVNAVKVALAIPVTAGSWLLATVLGYDETTRLAIYLFSLGLFLDSLNRSVSAVFTARERSDLLSIGVIVQRTTGALLGIAALVAGLGVLAVCAAYAVGSGAGLVVGIAILARRFGGIQRRSDRGRWPELVREAAPFALYDSFQFLLTKIDTILLSLMATQVAVGYYGAASRVYEASFFVPLALSSGFFAMYTYLTPTSEPTIGAVFERSIKLALAVLVPLAVTLAMLADPVTTLLFGDGFSAAAGPMRLLAPSVALIGVAFLSVSLVALRTGPRRVIPLTGGLVVLNVALNLALVPSMGAKGSALAMSLSTGAFAVGGVALASAAVGRPHLVRMLAAPALAGAAMALTMSAISAPVLALLAGGGAFVLAFIACDALVAPSDLRFMVELVRHRSASAADDAETSPASRA